MYRSTHYCLGSGAHFALGSFVDLAGNDEYNVRPDSLERWGAIGRDGSIATFIDAAGNDRYDVKVTTAGHCDLNSIAVFWERTGDDTYALVAGANVTEPRVLCFGSSVPYPPFNTLPRRDAFGRGRFSIRAGAMPTLLNWKPPTTRSGCGSGDPASGPWAGISSTPTTTPRPMRIESNRGLLRHRSVGFGSGGPGQLEERDRSRIGSGLRHHTSPAPAVPGNSPALERCPLTGRSAARQTGQYRRS